MAHRYLIPLAFLPWAVTAFPAPHENNLKASEEVLDSKDIFGSVQEYIKEIGNAIHHAGSPLPVVTEVEVVELHHAEGSDWLIAESEHSVISDEKPQRDHHKKGKGNGKKAGAASKHGRKGDGNHHGDAKMSKQHSKEDRHGKGPKHGEKFAGERSEEGKHHGRKGHQGEDLEEGVRAHSKPGHPMKDDRHHGEEGAELRHEAGEFKHHGQEKDHHASIDGPLDFFVEEEDSKHGEHSSEQKSGKGHKVNGKHHKEDGREHVKGKGGKHGKQSGPKHGKDGSSHEEGHERNSHGKHHGGPDGEMHKGNHTEGHHGPKGNHTEGHHGPKGHGKHHGRPDEEAPKGNHTEGGCHGKKTKHHNGEVDAPDHENLVDRLQGYWKSLVSAVAPNKEFAPGRHGHQEVVMVEIDDAEEPFEAHYPDAGQEVATEVVEFPQYHDEAR